MQRFLVVFDDATPEQQNLITEYFASMDYGYWHQMTDVWLVADADISLTAADLRNALKTLVPRGTLLVMRIDDPRAWAGFGKPKVFEWLKTEWTKT